MKYFDYAASSPLYPEVLDILHKAQIEHFANPSAKHQLGHDLHEHINSFRKDFLRILSADQDDFFFFTSSATESNNTVIKGLNLNSGDVILYSPADHASLCAPIEFLANELKLELRILPLDAQGVIDQEKLKRLLDENIKLVTLTHVNNQSGVIQDIDSVSRLIKKCSMAHVHVDAVQSFGKIPCQLNSFIDSLSITSHKIGGPKGVAGLFLKNGHQVKPLLHGGGQENAFRSSTEAYPLILAFHKAMQITQKNLISSLEATAVLNHLIRTQLAQRIPAIQFPFRSTSPYIISLIFPAFSSDIILRHLEQLDIYISSTSACSSRRMGPNLSLWALGIPEKKHKHFLRISLASCSSMSEVEFLIGSFQKIWESLKHLRGNQ